MMSFLCSKIINKLRNCLKLKSNKVRYFKLGRKILETNSITGHAATQWLRHCATSRKVVVSIPDVVTGIFH